MILKLSIASLLLFILITLDVMFHGLLTVIDGLIFPNILSFQTELLNNIFLYITTLGNLSSMVIFSVIISIILWLKKDYISIKFLISSMMGISVLIFGLKELVGRLRPQDYVAEMFQDGNAFPSGHASSSMALSLALFFIIYPHLTSKVSKIIVTFLLLTFTTLIGISRIYFGVHYFSDVAGGMMLSTFWVLLMAWAFKLPLVSSTSKD